MLICRTNVLMELRKTLCHPYLVREELEHNTDLDAEAIYKNLVEASSKLTFLGKGYTLISLDAIVDSLHSFQLISFLS